MDDKKELNEVELNEILGGAHPEYIEELHDKQESVAEIGKGEMDESQLDNVLGGAPQSYIEEKGYFTESQIKEVSLPIEKKTFFVKRALNWIQERFRNLRRNDKNRTPDRDKELTETELDDITAGR